MRIPSKANLPAVRKACLWLLAGVVLVALLGAGVAPLVVKSLVQKSVGGQLQRELTIDKLSINPFALSITVRGLRLKERSGSDTFVAWEELYVNLSSASLWRRAPVIVS